MASINTPAKWERQPDETSKAFEAFCEYRDMGTQRSLSKVAAKLQKSETLMGRWSGNYRWVERATAWDAEQARKELEAAEAQRIKDVVAMRKRHADLANAMLVKAARALQRIPEDEIRAADVSRMVETASKLERISRGDVGEVIEERDGGKSDNPVTFYIPDNHRNEPSEE